MSNGSEYLPTDSVAHQETASNGPEFVVVSAEGTVVVGGTVAGGEEVV